MITIYAEKNDVGAKIVAAYGGLIYEGKQLSVQDVDKYKESKDFKRFLNSKGYLPCTYNGEQFCVTWGQGHMCELKQGYDYNPDYAKWANIPIPFLLDNYEIKLKEEIDFKTKKKTGKPNPYVKKQMDLIKSLFEKSDWIINATDDDREGETIFAYVYQFLGVNKPYKKARFDSQTKEGFLESLNFNNLVSSDITKHIEEAGRARSLADWIVGINLTVAMSLKYKTIITIGRVQTTVLYLIVAREKEIQKFVSKPFYYITAEFTNKNGEKYLAKHSKNQIFDKNEANALFSKVNGKQGTITKKESKIAERKVPLLYNTDTLNIESNQKFGFSSSITLQTVDGLYKKGYVSYPRTSSEYLTDDMTDIVNNTLNKLKEAFPQYQNFIFDDNRQFSNRHYNTKKVESHYAIIPTGSIPESLTDNEQKIYDLICKSLIRTIYSNAKIENTVIETTVEGELFKTTGTIIVDPQWMVIDGFKEDDIIPNVKENEIVDGQYFPNVGKTEPPKRYTESSLLASLISAGKIVDDKNLKEVLNGLASGGIGTGATRPGIIKHVIDLYCTMNKKYIVPTEKGIGIIDVLPIDDLKSPEMTAKWELRLKDIEKQKDSFDNFINDIETATTKWCEIIQNSPISNNPCFQKEDKNLTDLKCPVCGKNLRKFDWGYACSGFKKGDEHCCNFHIGYNVANTKINDATIKDLIIKKRTKCIHGLHKKNSTKTFCAYLIIDEQNQIKFSFDTGEKCPICGSPILVSEKSWYCSNYKNGCKVTLWDKIAERKISDSEKRTLLQKRETGLLDGFKNKKGEDFSTILQLTDNGDVIFKKRNKNS